MRKFIFVFIIPALIFTNLLYGQPWKKLFIDLSKKEIRLYSEIEESFTKYIVSKLFQTTLGLELYDLKFENRNKISINKKPLTEEQRKVDPEGGAMEITILESESNATTSLYAQIGKDDRKVISVGSKPILVVRNIVYRSPEKFVATITVDTKKPGPVDLITVETDLSESRLYVENNKSVWFLKFFAIFVLWGAFLLFVKKLFNFWPERSSTETPQ